MKITHQSSDVMKVMAGHLATWLEDLYQQHIPVSLTLIQGKASSLHETVKEEMEENEAAKLKPFGASGGWLHCLQKQ